MGGEHRLPRVPITSHINCTCGDATVCLFGVSSMTYDWKKPALKRLASAVQLRPWPPYFQSLTPAQKPKPVPFWSKKFTDGSSEFASTHLGRAKDVFLSQPPNPSLAKRLAPNWLTSSANAGIAKDLGSRRISRGGQPTSSALAATKNKLPACDGNREDVSVLSSMDVLLCCAWGSQHIESKT